MMNQAENMAAISAAVIGAEFILSRLDKEVLATKGSLRDVLTQVDIEAEKLISLNLSYSFPFEIIGEETSSLNSRHILGEDRDCIPSWIVDPIDGTANYLSGSPDYAVSIGLVGGNKFIVGAVCAPKKRELYCTLANESILNGKLIKYKFLDFANSLVGVSFSGIMHTKDNRNQEYLLFGVLNDTSRGCLRTGSAALNLCNTASGKLQAAYGFNAGIWDIAAGVAIALNAGCCVSLMQMAPNSNKLAYIVGSAEHVDHIKKQMQSFRLINNTYDFLDLGGSSND